MTTSKILSFPAVRQARLPKAEHPARVLSFVRFKVPAGSGIDCWAVTPTGRYGDDCETGGRLAEEYLAYIGQNPTIGNSTLLTRIVSDMIENAAGGQGWSGVHVGFLAGVNRAAMLASAIDLRIARS